MVEVEALSDIFQRGWTSILSKGHLINFRIAIEYTCIFHCHRDNTCFKTHVSMHLARDSLLEENMIYVITLHSILMFVKHRILRRQGIIAWN